MKTTYDRCGELSDGLGDVGHGLDLLGGDPEPGPVHLLLAELELCRVLEDAVVPQQCEVLGGVGESLSYCWLPEQAVVNLPVYILDMSSDHVEPLVVGIARDMVAPIARHCCLAELCTLLGHGQLFCGGEVEISFGKEFFLELHVTNSRH